MKYKKQIVIICLFTFLFIPFNPSQKPKAEVLTLTTGAIVACAALATACGVVITNPDMLEDIGTRVYEGIKSIDGAITNVGNKVVVKVIPVVVSKVFDVLFSLPESDFYVDKNISENFSISQGDNILFTFDISDIDLHRTYNFNFDFEKNPELVIGLRNQSGRNILSTSLINCTEPNPSIEMILNYVSIAYYGYINYNNAQVATKKVPTDIYSLFVKSNVSGSLNADYDKSICIPYTPLNSQGVSEDKPKEYFPTGSGSISVPNDRPIGGFSPSIDNPITKPSDLLQEGELVDSNTNTDTDTGVNTGDSVLDKFGSWLGSLLSSLFAPLVNLLQSILDILKGLVIPSEWNTLDFSPLYFSFSEKFPFCIPFDLIRMVKEFNAEVKEPVFYVDMSGFSSDKNSLDEVGFTLDLTKFDELITIVRTLTLISFVFFIALKTRDIIKG